MDNPVVHYIVLPGDLETLVPFSNIKPGNNKDTIIIINIK